MKVFTIAILMVLLACIHCEVFNKKRVSNVSDSICLDGQPAFFYINENYIKQSDHVMIHFMATPSASFCGSNSLANSLETCLSLQTQISNYWAQTMSFNNTIFDKLDYKSWMKVIIPHCDGGIFQGYASQPTKYKTKDLYFRGNAVIKNIFAELSKIIDISSSNVVLSGSGIGAMGALIWSKWFKQSYSKLNSNNFKLVLDSIPKNSLSFKSGTNVLQTSLQNMLKLANIDQPHPFTVCAIRKEGQQEKCFFLDFNYNYLNFPTLVIQSQYDSYTVTKGLQIQCISQSGSLSNCSFVEKQYLEKYRSQNLINLFKFVNSNLNNKGQNAIWSVACSGSNFLINNKWQQYKIQGRSSYEIIISFSQNQRPTEYDKYSWPSNLQCSGV